MEDRTGAAEQPLRRRTTSADVARRAKVSRTTVSFILNGVVDQRISEPTREAVLAAARELDYRPNRSARDLATGTTRSLVCFVPAGHLGEGALRLVGELSAALSRSGYSLAVYFESSDRAAFESLVRDLQPSAVFPLYGALPEWIDDDLLQEAVVFRGTDVGTGEQDAGARAQAEHLVERGHRRIGYVGIDDRALGVLSRGRRRAVEAVCAERGLPAPVGIDVQISGDDAAEALSRLRDAGVTGVCCYNDEIAFMMLHSIDAARLRCPEDVAVIGYDAIPLSAWSVPPLSTVSWDPRGAGTVFADSIISAVDPGHVPVDPATIGGLVAARVLQRRST